MTEESGFLSGFSRGTLIALVLKCGIWTALNVGLIGLIFYLDHSFLWSDTALGFLLVPVGLVNAALLIDAGYKIFRKPNWSALATAGVEIGNSIYFFIVLNELYSQSGPL